MALIQRISVFLGLIGLTAMVFKSSPKPELRQLEMAKEILYRSSTIERKDNIDEEARTIELSFSSEASVERVFGNEVLEHSSDAVVGPSGRRRHR